MPRRGRGLRGGGGQQFRKWQPRERGWPYPKQRPAYPFRRQRLPDRAPMQHAQQDRSPQPLNFSNNQPVQECEPAARPLDLSRATCLLPTLPLAAASFGNGEATAPLDLSVTHRSAPNPVIASGMTTAGQFNFSPLMPRVIPAGNGQQMSLFSALRNDNASCSAAPTVSGRFYSAHQAKSECSGGSAASNPLLNSINANTVEASSVTTAGQFNFSPLMPRVIPAGNGQQMSLFSALRNDNASCSAAPTVSGRFYSAHQAKSECSGGSAASNPLLNSINANTVEASSVTTAGQFNFSPLMPRVIPAGNGQQMSLFSALRNDNASSAAPTVFGRFYSAHQAKSECTGGSAASNPLLNSINANTVEASSVTTAGRFNFAPLPTVVYNEASGNDTIGAISKDPHVSADLVTPSEDGHFPLPEDTSNATCLDYEGDQASRSPSPTSLSKQKSNVIIVSDDEDMNDEDGDEEEKKEGVTLVMGNSKNCGRIYRPNVDKPDDVDELCTSADKIKPASRPTTRLALKKNSNSCSRKASPTKVTKTKNSCMKEQKTKRETAKKETPAKKETAKKEKSKIAKELDKIREEARAHFANNEDGEDDPPVKKTTKVKKDDLAQDDSDDDNNYDDDDNDDSYNDSEDEEDDDESIRVSRRLAVAYKRASSRSEMDKEVRSLKRAGVILPNGFTPMPPLFSHDGEILAELWRQGRNKKNATDER